MTISFISHILPQLISLFILIILFWNVYNYFCRSKFNQYNIGVLSLAILMLIYGKIALFLMYQTPELVKMHIDTSLLVYFAVMPIVLTRLKLGIPRRFQIWLQVSIIPFLALLLETSLAQGRVIFVADLYLICILLLSKTKGKYWWIGSFFVLGIINLLSVYIANFWTYYAWLEIVGQFLFLIGFFKIRDEII
jgi:hypothetical protein